MTLPTAQLCVCTKYDQSGKLLGYAPWLQVGRDPEAAAVGCFQLYGSNLVDCECDCVDIHLFDLPRFLLSVFTPATITTNKKIRRIRRSEDANAET